MVLGMIGKFEKCWSEFSDILAIAIILDPRYKLTFIEWCYRKLYEGHYAFKLKKKKIRDRLFSLFANYTRGSGDSSNATQRGHNDVSRSTSSIIIKHNFFKYLLCYCHFSVIHISVLV